MRQIKDILKELKEGGAVAKLDGTTLTITVPTWTLYKLVERFKDELYTVAYVRRWASSLKPCTPPEKRDARGAATSISIDVEEPERPVRVDWKQANLFTGALK